MNNNLVLDLGNPLYRIFLETLKSCNKLQYPPRIYLDDDSRWNTFLSVGTMKFPNPAEEFDDNDKGSYNMTSQEIIDEVDTKGLEKSSKTDKIYYDLIAQNIIEEVSRR